MWKEEHKWVAGFGKFMARVAVVLLCVLGVSLAVTMSVDAYRSKFFQTVQEIWEDSVVHTYDVGEEGQEFVPHEPSYIPEGYEEVRRAEGASSFSIEYANEDGNYIFWDQKLVGEGTWSAVDSKYEIEINELSNKGTLAIYQYPNQYIAAYFETEQYSYTIVADSLEINEIEDMFLSIK